MAERGSVGAGSGRQAGGDARGVESASLFVVGATPDHIHWDGTVGNSSVSMTVPPRWPNCVDSRVRGLQEAWRRSRRMVRYSAMSIRPTRPTLTQAEIFAMTQRRWGIQISKTSPLSARRPDRPASAGSAKRRKLSPRCNSVHAKATLATFHRRVRVHPAWSESSAGAYLLKAAEVDVMNPPQALRPQKSKRFLPTGLTFHASGRQIDATRRRRCSGPRRWLSSARWLRWSRPVSSRGDRALVDHVTRKHVGYPH